MAPIEGVLYATFGLIIVDLLLGMLSAWKRKEEIVSNKIKISVVKLLVYELALVFAFVVGQYLTSMPVLNMVSSVIGLTELKSVLEHMNEITGNNLLDAILSALSPRDPQDKD